jgi:plasmid maintenance system killer protein
MIRSFHDKDTEALYEGRNVRRFQAFQKHAVMLFSSCS